MTRSTNPRKKDPFQIADAVVKVLSGVLGIVFAAVMVYQAFRWLFHR